MCVVLVAAFVSALVPGSRLVSVGAGVLLAGFAVMSFMGDMKTVNCLAEVHRVHKRYEWAVEYVLVFDVVACVAGLSKASSQRNV